MIEKKKNFIEDYQYFETNLQKNNIQFLTNFIVLEGPDGSGKTTQVQLLKEFFQEHNVKVLVTEEPEQTTEKGMYLKNMLLNSEKIDVYEEVLLILLGRYNHLKNFILPRLEEGYIIVCDRYIDSTYVYQGYVGGLSFRILSNIYGTLDNFLMPAKTFLLNVPYETLKKRRDSRAIKSQNSQNNIEQKPESFHKKVVEGYQCLEGKRYIGIDGTFSVEETSLHIRNHSLIQHLILKNSSAND